MNAVCIMRLAAALVKGDRVTIPALSGSDLSLLLGAVEIMRGVIHA